MVPGLFEVSHLLLVINCSLNFPIYFLAGGAKLCRQTHRQASFKQTFQLRGVRPMSM